MRGCRRDWGSGIPTQTESGHRAVPGEGGARRGGTSLLVLENHLRDFEDYTLLRSGVMVNVNSWVLEKNIKAQISIL